MRSDCELASPPRRGETHLGRCPSVARSCGLPPRQRPCHSAAIARPHDGLRPVVCCRHGPRMWNCGRCLHVLSACAHAEYSSLPSPCRFSPVAATRALGRPGTSRELLAGSTWDRSAPSRLSVTHALTSRRRTRRSRLPSSSLATRMEAETWSRAPRPPPTAASASRWHQDYVVTADAGMSCELMDARVVAGAYSKVDISCDTGIR
jgi:hypothetical protein